MPRVFTRLITVRVEGEIYDTETKPEDILKNYEWRCHENLSDPKGFDIVGKHKDHRGKITKAIVLPNIRKDNKKPDTEFFLI
jgi:hypothetical protein